jgi:ABC-type dipeptide/oligopeptide/nickel transport system permease component
MKLLKYVLQRLFLLFPVLLGVVTLTFMVSRVLAADPAALLAGPLADQAQVDRIRTELGIDRPLLTQYRLYMSNLLQGDLGVASHTRNQVADDLATRFPATLELLLVALLLATSIGIPLGVWAGIRKDGFPDHIARVINVLGVSVPQFWLGLILVYFLFYRLDLFPAPLGRLPIGVEAPRKVTGLYMVDSLLELNFDTFRQALLQIALPAITLGFAAMAPITRLVRNTMIEVLQSEYVQAARAFGIPNTYTYLVYALRNTMLPVMTFIAILFGNLLGGSVLVETIFSWPGLGFYAADSVLQSDYSAIQGFVILSATLYVLIFLVTDLLYWVVDPRTRLA